jgi:hypothetical protein
VGTNLIHWQKIPATSGIVPVPHSIIWVESSMLYYLTMDLALSMSLLIRSIACWVGTNFIYWQKIQPISEIVPVSHSIVWVESSMLYSLTMGLALSTSLLIRPIACWGRNFYSESTLKSLQHEGLFAKETQQYVKNSLLLGPKGMRMESEEGFTVRKIILCIIHQI